MRNKVGGAVAVLALAAASVVAAAAPAQAAPGDCGLGYTCLYSGYDFTKDWPQNHRMLPFAKCIDNLGKYMYNDKVSSVFNNGRFDEVRMYEHADKKGDYFLLARDRGKSNLSNEGWNDRISSTYFRTYYDGYVGSNDCR